jgi:hypothetical protein
MKLRPRTLIGWNVSVLLGKGYKKVLTTLLWAICICSPGLSWGFKFVSNHYYMPKGKCLGFGNRGSIGGGCGENLDCAFLSREVVYNMEEWGNQSETKGDRERGRILSNITWAAFTLDFVLNNNFIAYSCSWTVVGKSHWWAMDPFVHHTLFSVWALSCGYSTFCGSDECTGQPC